MKTFKLNKSEITNKVIELMKETQDVDMLSGFQKFLMLDEDGKLYITDWLSQNTTVENEHILVQMDAWNTEEALQYATGEGYEQYYDDYETKEEAEKAAQEEYYGWEDYSEQVVNDVLYRLEEMKNLNRASVEVK